ncbi:hypothetical protein K438DRAFT_1919489 [Mycena galopus ATCC 62051]|nr:hypothetical protein K438DRAFT_1919489 [Mycena galopus ATCC 62051]
MKVILAGTTGFIGSEVLAQCLRNPAITTIVVLSRRTLPAAHADHPKNFTLYSPEVLAELEGADACIWSMGTTAAIPAVEIDYPLAFARAFAPTIAASRATPFRYLHTSGVLAEKDQSKSLIFFGNGRRVKGKAETELLAFAQKDAYAGQWETYVARPAMVLPKKGAILKSLVGGLIGSVRVDVLAAAMIDVVCGGKRNGEWALENAEIVERGTALKKRQLMEYGRGPKGK